MKIKMRKLQINRTACLDDKHMTLQLVVCDSISPTLYGKKVSQIRQLGQIRHLIQIPYIKTGGGIIEVDPSSYNPGVQLTCEIRLPISANLLWNGQYSDDDDQCRFSLLT